jgi:DNA-binding SARP family transcriptional activator
MRFQVLGPLEVEADGGPVALGGPKERLLLALLLTRPNQVVSVEALLRGLWREQPPRSAGKTLQSHVMRLRRVLEPDRARGAAAEVLITREPGYLLRVPPESLDATRFEELIAAARRALASGADEKAASMLRRALGLWRGQAFEEFLDSDFAAAESNRLGELRLVALEDRIEADLRLSRHRELVAELEGLVKEHPLRERLWTQLLLALYRSGRQADALLAYRRARSILVEELGIDPGTDLRRLHAAILAQDSGLDLRRPVETATAPAPELPQALEPVGPPFVGRSAELAWLEAAWTSATRDEGGVTFLAGGQGIGKTRLAAELAGMVHDQGGWVLYGRCAPTAHDPLQPFEHARVGADRSPPTWPVSGPDQAPSAYGRELARSLVDQADGAVLLILDDLHLAQAAALEALAGLAAVAITRKLLVLGTYRDDEASAQLVALLDRLDPSGRARKRLVPLNRDEVAQVLALYESGQSTWAAVDEVLERTGGLPLLVHDAAGERARAQAANQVQEAAGQIVRSRGHLRLVEAKLSGDLIDLHELHEHSQRVARLVTTQSPPAEQVDHPTAAICPYKGLARFEPDDAAYFFGRERLVAELVTHLIGAGLLGVVGPSGSGKSSLVRAGLLPVLREGMLPGSDRWRQLVIRPGEHPVRELARAVPGDGALDSSGVTDGDREPDDRPSPWQQDGDWLLRAIAGQDHLLLVVDQFEEVFTTCRDEAERAAFLAALTQGALSPENYATVVIAVRADYYGRCAADPRLAGLLAANHLLVGPMHPHELRRTIELPARRAGLRLEPGLAEAMIGEVTDQPGGLPLLSCALLEGWEHRQGRTLTLAAYQQAGGVRGAVARLAERAWQQLQPGDQDAARRILIRLAGPGEGETVVRRRVSLSELAADGDERAAAVLHTLADHRLLTLGDQTVELAHEALLREWPRLRGWLEEDVQGRALHRHLIGAAKEWDAAGRDPGELYRGARLTGALDWADAHDADLNPLERAFLNASRAAAEREVADARRQAEREAHTSRRLRGLLAGLAAMLVLALIAGGLALTLRSRAERQALVADSGRLGALALTEDQLDRALLLARQGVALDDSLESRSDLLAALLRSPAATAVIRPQLDGITPLGLSPDGRLLAMGDYGGRVAVYDLQTRRPVPGDFRAGRSVNDLDFSPDGSLLAVATGGGLVQLWDVGTATLRRQLRTAVWATGVEFSADGRTLVTLSADEADTPSGLGDSFLTRWDVGNGRRLRGPVHVTSGGETLITTQDRQRLVIVTRSEVLVAAAGSLQPLRRFPSRPGQPDQFVASLRPTDGQTLALGLDGGAVEFLDLSSGRRRRLGRHEASVAAVAFSPDGATLATGGSDRKVTVWDVAS